MNNTINFRLKIWLIVIYILVSLTILVGGLTRLTDSGLSITSWEIFKGIFPPLNNTEWQIYFNLYKKIPEYSLQNFNMTLEEFKVIFWWEWAHRILGRIIGLAVLIPLIFFYFKYGFSVFKNYLIILILVCFQGFIGWYMVSSGLVERIDVSHYRLALHLVLAFIIISIVFWKYLELSKLNLKIYFNGNLLKLFIGFIFLQLIIGAFTSGLDAGKIYNTWPLMGDNYFPDDNRFSYLFSLNAFDDRSLVQFMHRNLAYIIVILYLFFLYKVLKYRIAVLYVPIFLIGLFLLLQVILGIFTILSGANIFYSSLHQINSIFLVTSTVYLLHINQNKKI